MVKAKEVEKVVVQERELPESGMPEKEMPKQGNRDNVVMFGEVEIEIKPTKLMYMRNRTAEFYKMIEVYPLPDLLSATRGAFGDNRDGDKCVIDWLIAATDDEELVRKYYNDIDTGTVERILEIFKRVNKISEKEEKLKNLTANGKVV